MPKNMKKLNRFCSRIQIIGLIHAQGNLNIVLGVSLCMDCDRCDGRRCRSYSRVKDDL